MSFKDLPAVAVEQIRRADIIRVSMDTVCDLVDELELHSQVTEEFAQLQVALIDIHLIDATTAVMAPLADNDEAVRAYLQPICQHAGVTVSTEGWLQTAGKAISQFFLMIANFAKKVGKWVVGWFKGKQRAIIRKRLKKAADVASAVNDLPDKSAVVDKAKKKVEKTSAKKPEHAAKVEHTDKGTVLETVTPPIAADGEVLATNDIVVAYDAYVAYAQSEYDRASQLSALMATETSEDTLSKSIDKVADEHAKSTDSLVRTVNTAVGNYKAPDEKVAGWIDPAALNTQATSLDKAAGRFEKIGRSLDQQVSKLESAAKTVANRMTQAATETKAAAGEAVDDAKKAVNDSKEAVMQKLRAVYISAYNNATKALNAANALSNNAGQFAHDLSSGIVEAVKTAAEKAENRSVGEKVLKKLQALDNDLSTQA